MLLDLNSVSTTITSDQVQPSSAFQKLHYRNLWHKMSFISFFIVDEVLKRRYHQNVKNGWARFLYYLKIEDNLNQEEVILRVGVIVRIAKHCE